mgnify:FL=1
MIIALALAYYLIKRAGLMICNLKSDDEIDADELEEKITNKLNKR